MENQVCFFHSFIKYFVIYIYVFLDHLTSFALLLNGNGNDPCDDNQEDYIITWISLAFVALAIIIVFVGIVFLEIKIRIKTHQQNKNMNSLTKRISRLT